MSLKNVDIGAVISRIGERRIEEAMKEGKFDNLAGKGRPLDLEPMPADENARMLWWSLRIMRNHEYTPDEIRYRKMLDGLRERLYELSDESKLEPMVAQINALVRKLNTMGTNVIGSTFSLVDIEQERARLREKSVGATDGTR
jgi:hypothetical protein